MEIKFKVHIKTIEEDKLNLGEHKNEKRRLIEFYE